MYRQSRTDDSPSDRWIWKYGGGFSFLLNELFPPDKTPFTDEYLDKLDKGALTEFIAGVIAECSEIIGVPPHEMQWDEFRRYINFRYGENDKGLARYSITKVGGFNVIRDSHFHIDPTPIILEKKENKEAAAENRKLGAKKAEQQFVLEKLDDYAKKLFKKLPTVQICCKPDHVKAATKYVLTLVLSDLHFGSDIDAEETGALSFGRTEEARRMASVIRQTIEYMPERRSETELEVLILGDIIDGVLHDPRSGAVIAEQMARAIHILFQALVQLSAHFGIIRVRINSGNHDRITSRHKQRATNQKWDSHLWIIGTALKYAVTASVKNVSFFMPKTPFLSYEVLGHRMFATHGDTVITEFGYPGNSIPVKRIESQVNRMNASLKDLQEYKVCFSGHTHNGTFTPLGNGTKIIINPPLVPVDPYALSIGIFEAYCGQWLVETSEARPILSACIAEVGPIDDKDASLDQLIQPFTDAL